MALTLGHVTGPTGTTQNVGGTTQRFRGAPVSDFTSIAKKDELSVAATNAAMIEISDDHTFTSGKGFYEFYMTRDTGKIDFKINQDRDTTGSLVTFTCVIPGDQTATDAILLQVANNRMIYTVELADGEWIQIGSERFPAETKYEWGSENNEKGERGWKITITGFETSKQKYVGAFTMHA